MTEPVTFGDVTRFAVSVRWATDSEPPSHRPAGYGWSTGDLEIFIAGRSITQVRRGAGTQAHASWYLLPVLDWLAENWAALLHEEDFSWPEKSSAPAVVACRRALDRWIGEEDDFGRDRYRSVQAWYRRHALRAAAEGGLLPDLFIRRFLDEIELSWSASPPLFAPEGFSFLAQPGTARLCVDDVAGPLWEVLSWAASTAPAVVGADQESIRALETRIAAIRATPVQQFASTYVSPSLLELVQAALTRLGAPELLASDGAAEIPAIRAFSPAVAMFGGVSPDLGRHDVELLAGLLVSSSGLDESEVLLSLASERADLPLGVPHEDGYAFAAELLEELDEPASATFVDIGRILEQLGIRLEKAALSTDTIRGVAIAGGGFGPTILLNATSVYNAAEEGRRFTMAHELCHILFDRARARRVTIASGPWVAPGIEKRANAFAASLLMPPSLVRRLLPSGGRIDREHVVAAARALRVSESALVEHAYNLDLIGEWDRERLRAAFRN